MTKKLNRAPMELDLDTFLQLQSISGSDEDDLDSIPHRTVDEILNDSDSSSSSSSSSPSFKLRDIQHKSYSEKSPNSFSKEENLEKSSVFSPQTPVETLKPEEKKVVESLISSFRSRKPGEFSRNSYSLGRSTTSRPLPTLFGGVRANPKPGAALAAAAAASRSIPTPHAAAIKSRRANSDAALLYIVQSEELDSVDVTEATDPSGKVSVNVESETIKLDSRIGDSDVNAEDSPIVVAEHINGELSGREDVAEISHENTDASTIEETCQTQEEAAKLDEIELGTNYNSDVDESSTVLSSTDVVENNKQLIDASGNANESNLSSTCTAAWDEIPPAIEVNSKMEESFVFTASEIPDAEKSHGENSVASDDTDFKSDITEVVDDRVVQWNSKRGGKKSAKKLRSFMKPLELAEELEKKHAYSGLHWEEGAAAQPMRLEGIRRGPPAVGYLQIDVNNAITRTISSQVFRRDHGSPQVLAVHANFIAVGMSKGLILVVPSRYSAQNADSMDAKMSFLAPQGDKSHSPVTSLCFNPQGDLLLAGYGNGHIIVWDVQRAATAKVITGEHTAPVVHTLFLGQEFQVTRQFKAVTGDCKGLVLLHTFSVVPLLNRFSIKTQCLLDGQKTGIVLCASPLLLEDSGSSTAVPGNATASSSGIGSMMGGVVGGSLFNEGSSLVEEGVVIFVTHQTALVARLSPNLEVYARLSKPDGVRDGSMPYTAWKCMPLSQGSTENKDRETLEKASLVIAWDRKVQVGKLVKSELKIYKEWTLDSAAIGVAWLDDQMLVILTLRRQICLFSKDGNELHRTSFPADCLGADDFIVYHTYLSNLFGNPEKSYHNCLAVRGATIYVLGPTHLVASRLLPWKERIQVLRTAGDWMGALDMAMRLYDGHAHGVIDLPRTLDAIREAVMLYLVDLILSYVDEVFSYISVAFCNQIEREEQVQKPKSKNTSVHSEMEDQYARVGGVAVEFCVHIKRIDILFDEIFSKFVAVQHGGTFLELLEPYVLKDMLGCLPPEIMQALVEHYSSKGWLQRVEQCVLHMDISSLDFNQVVRLCREHGLYGALIYLFNKGLDDFKAPLEELLLVLQSSEREISAAIGYRMLVYLKYCFTGLSFPPGHGSLPHTRLPLLRKELLQFLLEDSNEMNSKVVARFKSQFGVCPNLFHLLRLDTEATLDVLKFAFPEEEANIEHGLLDANKEDNEENNDKNTEDLNSVVQSTVNTLIHILDIDISDEVSSGASDMEFIEIWPSKKDTGHLLEFIAFFVACGRATITKTVLNHILEFLTSESIFSLPSQKIETCKRREKQMLALLRVVPEADWNPSYVLHLCEKAQYYRVCGYIYTTKHQYDAALDSYMKDLDEPIYAFSFMNTMLLHLKDTEFVTFRSAVVSKIPELFNLSREGTCLLILDHYKEESEHILSELRSNPKGLFLYLKTIIEVHLSGTLNFSSLEKGCTPNLQNGSKQKNQSNEVELYLERISNFPKLVRDNPFHINDEVVELYLKLLCQYERSSVLKFLETFENYRVERCLRLCQEYRVTDAAAFLLERVGDVGSALLLTLSGLNENFHKLGSAVEDIISDFSTSSYSEKQLLEAVSRIGEVNAVCDILHSSIGLCQRNSQRLDPEESEFLWFQLLDSFCEPLRDPSDAKIVSRGNISSTLAATFDVNEEKEEAVDNWRIPKSHGGAPILRKLFAQFIKEIVEGMINGYVRLPTIMSKLLSDNGSQVFGDFKLIILGMLGTYGFEKRILDTAKSLIEDDTFYTMSLLKRGASHGYAPQNLLCHICGCPLTKKSSTSGIRVFNCGHTTHLQCEFQDHGSSNRFGDGCPVCVPKKNTRGSRSESVLIENPLVKNFVSKSQQTQGTNAVQHLHESDLVERPYGAQQIPRFEILSNLKNSQRSLQIESLPQLRLSPPVVYHEKIQKGINILGGESGSASVKGVNSSRQLRELKMKKSSLHFPIKSSIFGNEMTRKLKLKTSSDLS
ncbi:Vacuolar protein sorting-associated protein 8-like protein [Thalictrum thalictroides]|uniref:Vacuolar protein sorting-associated protein 8-like protein n=1 Tax=Thalictrum thalictroides TaxID=46969 RepID=A0A7J6WW25_THATH|nr:Vacuolar protein sorting-associated protein 8-like protein [Thalictrum thalictroides]